MSRSVRTPVPASVPILDRLDRADLGLVLAASTCDRIALLGGRGVGAQIPRPQ